MKLQLPSVTLVCTDCLDSGRAIKVLDHCKNLCDFGDVKFLSSIPNNYEHWVKIMPLNSLIAYSIFMLTKIHEHINTSHFITVQRDGWILNPQSWNPEWLELDYIGPIFMQYDHVGSGGFSLRSKKLMESVSPTMPEWDGTQKGADAIQKTINYYEDGQICFTGFDRQFKFATLEQAAAFGQGGNRNPKYFREKPFGFHRTHQVIDFSTGVVDSSDPSRIITNSYDAEIDSLV